MNIIKSLIELVVFSCVSTTVAEALAPLTNQGPKSKLEKIAIAVGGGIIGSMVADKAVDYVNNEIEDTMKQIKEITDSMESLEDDEEI